MDFTMKQAKLNEKRVAQQLQDILGGAWAMNHNLMGVWDLLGVVRGNSYIVEVKERRQVWDTFFIEEKKVNDIMLEKEQNKIDNAYLVFSAGGKDWIYDVEKIREYPIVEVAMNRRTAQGLEAQGVKVVKRVYEFPINEFVAAPSIKNSINI